MGTRQHVFEPTMARLITLATLAAGASAYTSLAGTSMLSRSRISMKELMTPAKLEEAFARFDVDGSGQVDREEFVSKMKTLDMPFSDMELEQMFNEMDDSSNGGVDAEEFQAYVVNNAHVGVVRRLAAQPNKIREVYESFKGEARVLELEAFQAGMKSLGLPYNNLELEDMFGQIDETNNGGVDYDEFKDFMSSDVLPKWAQVLKK